MWRKKERRGWRNPFPGPAAEAASCPVAEAGPGRGGAEADPRGTPDLPPFDRSRHGDVLAVARRQDYCDGTKTFAWLHPDRRTPNLPPGLSTKTLPLDGSEQFRDWRDAGGLRLVMVEGQKTAAALLWNAPPWEPTRSAATEAPPPFTDLTFAQIEVRNGSESDGDAER